MFWKTDLGKFLVILLITLVIILLIAIPSIILNSQPVQTAHVEVVSKRIEKRNGAPALGNNTWHYVTFKFPDGSEKEFGVQNAKTYDSLQEGDTGMLSYKEMKNNTRELGNKKFISFEKDS